MKNHQKLSINEILSARPDDNMAITKASMATLINVAEKLRPSKTPF